MADAAITGSQVRVYTIPTDAPEADGTFEWTSTTMVLVEIRAETEQALVTPMQIRRLAN